MYDLLAKGEFPATEDDSVLGHVVSSCWHSGYWTMKNVEGAIEQSVGTLCEVDGAACLSLEEHAAAVRECQEFLARQGQKSRSFRES
jgi:hypothetical protein